MLQIPELLYRPELLPMVFWAALVAVTSAVPVRRLMRTGYLNMGPFIVFTILLLYGTGPGLAAGWLCGAVTALSSTTGGPQTYLLRICRNSTKHALGLLAAGLVLWGPVLYQGLAATATADGAVFLRLLAAYALYVAVKSLVEVSWSLRRHGTWQSGILRRLIDRKRLLAWFTPLGAFILALVYVSSGPILIAMLAAVGIARMLAVRDDGGPRSSLSDLIDALRFVRIGDMTQLTSETHRVLAIAMAIGRKMQLPFRNLALLEKAAVLHNVGYISADRSAMLKPRQLTAREIESVLKHPRYGFDLLHTIAGLESVAEIVHCHHESPNGSGFPRGLRADDIPLEASIIKVSEAFVAMTSPRLYRSDRMSADDALNEIHKGIGTKFDPVASYYLFKITGRDDLAPRVTQELGPPQSGSIRARLQQPGSKTFDPSDRTLRRKFALKGLVLVTASVMTLWLLSALGGGGTLGGGGGWLTDSFLGGTLVVALLGLGALAGVRLGGGAYVSWASALALAAALLGGPIHACLVGTAFAGWAMLLGVQRQSSPALSSVRTSAPIRDPVTLINARVWPDRCVTPIMYGVVLMIAGVGAWSVPKLAGPIAVTVGLGWIGAKLLPAGLAILGFYLTETMAQLVLLRSSNVSVFRLWQLNYLKIFPEPVTYAVVGYAMVIGMDLIGPAATIALMLLPVIWRHSTLRKRAEQLTMMNSLVRAIVSVIDERDKYTDRHSANVVDISILIARQIGKSEPFVEQLADAALLHDIGKVSWPKYAAIKQGSEDKTSALLRLTHQNISAEIAAQAGFDQRTVDIIRHHHEQFDGGGFPRGLCGYEIPLGARILRVADGFEASLHEGSYIGIPAGYRASFEIKRGSGTLYDPAIVRALLSALNTIDFSKLVLSGVKQPGTGDPDVQEPVDGTTDAAAEALKAESLVRR
jgi:putative nucleotidyltransferase with HDIG domain